jgi:hypothetical protein
MVHASAVLPVDPPDAAGADAPAAADEPPAVAAVLAEAVDDELPEQAVKPSRHRPAPSAANGMYWRIPEVVIRTSKQSAVMDE